MIKKSNIIYYERENSTLASLWWDQNNREKMLESQ